MPHIDKSDGNPIAELLHLVVYKRGKQADSGFGVIHGVKRFNRIAAGAFALAVFPFSFKFLDVRAVTQHNPTEVACCIGRADRSMKSVFREQR